MENIIRINKKDNVAVALISLKEGQRVMLDDCIITLREDVEMGHKIAIKDIDKGHKVYKYGYTIGYAIKDIRIGQLVHIHNISTCLTDMNDYTYEKEESSIEKTEDRTFMGYRRSNGNVGVRNEIWIIPTVGCVNNVVRAVERKAKRYVCEGVDDICAFTHPYGCSQLGEDQDNTRRILANLIQHPNAGGVLVMGLGCENSNIDELKKYIGDYDEERVKFLVAQDCEDEIEEALILIRELVDNIRKFKRVAISCNELVIGLKCGGSDGLSGITANPTVGEFSDMLIGMGGTTILTEVPEMFGAEQELMNRCRDMEVFDKLVKLINDFKGYYIEHNQVIYENPSPGNKAGGISTLEDKSLGCIQKSGSTEVCDVLGYGQWIKNKGLNILSAPGNDLVAATALAASGAHIVLFTTGRGTPFASPVPTVKISSNTDIYIKKNKWIDFDCGEIIGGENIESIGGKLFEYVMEVASGRRVKSEEVGYKDMAIFKQGVTL